MKPYFQLMVTLQSDYDYKYRSSVSKVIGMNTSNIRTMPPRSKKARPAAVVALLVWPLLTGSPASYADAPDTAGPPASEEAEPKIEMTKQEKAAKAAELAPTMTAMLADPGFPATASADLHIDVEIVVYMGGFHLSTLAVSTAFTGTDYEIRSNVQTEGIVDWVVKTNAVIGAKGQFIESRARPLLYNSDITDKKQRQLVAISWPRADGILEPAQILSFPEYNLEKYPVSEQERQRSADPMSAIMQIILAASQNPDSPASNPPSNPCGGTIPVYDGRRRFDLIMEPRGVEEISTGRGAAFEGEALKCWIGFKRVAGYKPRTPKRSDRTDGLSEWPDIYMWLAPVQAADTVVHMPVRFYADTRLGSVVARATKLVAGYDKAVTEPQIPESAPSEQTRLNPDN